MEELLENISIQVSKRPLLGYGFSVLLFILSLFYMKLHSDSIHIAGKRFVVQGFIAQKIDGESYLIPIFKETH